MNEGRYRLIGSTASPYAIKLRALLRYRRIPFDWVIMTKALRKATEHLRPNLIPVLQYPDGTFRGETTMLAYDLDLRCNRLSKTEVLLSLNNMLLERSAAGRCNAHFRIARHLPLAAFAPKLNARFPQ